MKKSLAIIALIPLSTIWILVSAIVVPISIGYGALCFIINLLLAEATKCK